jgi:hypothetical protein
MAFVLISSQIKKIEGGCFELSPWMSLLDHRDI